MPHASTCSCSRRFFLRGSGLTLAGFGVASLFPTPFIRHAMAMGANTNRRLLFIFMRGGNDGINTVIPHGDPSYGPGIRPNLAIDPLDSIDLNGFASLHPALGDMMEAYNAGDLAILHRIGYANNSKSHFDGQRIWENGDPNQTQLFEGWLYRYIQENAVSAGVDLPVLTIQSLPPVLTKGSESFVNIADPNNFDYIATEPLATKLSYAWRGVYSNLLGLESYRPLLSQTGVKLIDTFDEYETWSQETWNPLDPVSGWSLFPVDAASNQAGFSAESYTFFNSLKVAALSLLESDPANSNGTRIAGTQLGSFDTHNNQGAINGRQAELLSWLAYGFKSLRTVLSGAANDPRNYPSIWEDSLVCTLSEFGRTTVQNGNIGTDHAAASCQFIMGGTVDGGQVFNCDNASWQGGPQGVMFGVDGRYLLEQTDYRAVFWEILRDHMGAAPSGVDTIFPGYTNAGLGMQELGLIAAGSVPPHQEVQDEPREVP